MIWPHLDPWTWKITKSIHDTFLYAWSTKIERSLGWSRPAGSVLSQNRAKNYCHAILKTTSGKNFSNPLWQSSGKKERKKMGCLLSCHVALLSLEAVVLLDALTMFVLKSDPQVDTRLKWGSPSALPPQRNGGGNTARYVHTLLLRGTYTHRTILLHLILDFHLWSVSCWYKYIVCICCSFFWNYKVRIDPDPGGPWRTVQLSTQALIHVSSYNLEAEFQKTILADGMSHSSPTSI